MERSALRWCQSALSNSVGRADPGALWIKIRSVPWRWIVTSARACPPRSTRLRNDLQGLCAMAAVIGPARVRLGDQLHDPRCRRRTIRPGCSSPRRRKVLTRLGQIPPRLRRGCIPRRLVPPGPATRPQGHSTRRMGANGVALVAQRIADAGQRLSCARYRPDRPALRPADARPRADLRPRASPKTRGPKRPAKSAKLIRANLFGGPHKPFSTI